MAFSKDPPFFYNKCLDIMTYDEIGTFHIHNKPNSTVYNENIATKGGYEIKNFVTDSSFLLKLLTKTRYRLGGGHNVKIILKKIPKVKL